MIISKTPVRISFLGGGTDYPEHFRRHGGATLSTTINKYTYVTVNDLAPLHEHRIRVSYSKTELVRSVDEIEHPSVRECLKFMGLSEGLDIQHVSDLPAWSGTGSSSSFTVGLLNALYAYKGRRVCAQQLGAEAVYVEREMIKERVGLQDQYTCAIGGVLHLEFQRDGTVQVQPMVISPERILALQQRLMLFYTRIRRRSHEVLGQQLDRTQKGEVTLELKELATLVSQGVEVLSNGFRLSHFGELLHDGWQLKHRLSTAISNPFIDECYARARRAGAIGGKLLGAGGGGFLLLYVEPERQDDVRRVLSELPLVSFTFESRGTDIIFYDP